MKNPTNPPPRKNNFLCQNKSKQNPRVAGFAVLPALAQNRLTREVFLLDQAVILV
jgi:hypothetical protein